MISDWQELVCPVELHRFRPQSRGIWWWKARWFACRKCGKTEAIRAREVVCVLDEGMGEESRLQDGQLRINWLRRKERTRLLLDFDWVELCKRRTWRCSGFAWMCKGTWIHSAVVDISGWCVGFGLLRSYGRILRMCFGPSLVKRSK
ncbi:MAG: hypothetical protein NZ602_10610 [Thermoguttaceae bacterium]|nr:hypothetical protein [Thermoguttaceae bacterium]MDW8038958.1 hypothetical protein [Thermoguttaceae bacterium]